MIPSPSAPLRSARRFLQLHAQKIGVLGAAGWLTVVLVSCATSVTRTVDLPHSIPGASYVGSEACAQCHESINKHFGGSAHATLIARGPNAVNVGCESCHGPASVHVESGGAARTVIHPQRNPETCYECHAHLRGQFSLVDSHPVADGRMSCSACHELHRGDAHRGGGTQLLAQNDTCLQCHPAQRGPHVFEHEATREGCVSCHEPHGSVNQRMLSERGAILCLKCHFQRQTSPGRLAIGTIDHTPFLSRGTCWSAGCHEAVHGSQVSSSLRF